MATNKIIKVSELDLLSNITGAEEVTVSYLTPHKVVTSSEITYVGSYQYVFNEKTKRYDYSYVITDVVEIPKTYKIDANNYESYKFPLSMINGGNISSVKTIYATNSYYYEPETYGNYAKVNNSYVKIDYDTWTDEELLSYERYSLKNVDFEYVRNSDGNHVKIDNSYINYNTARDNAIKTYITNAQTFTYEYILPSEENGMKGYINYIPRYDKWTYTGDIVQYGYSYYTKANMLNYIDTKILSDRYNVFGINTLKINFDNNTSFSIQAINGSTGKEGEQGWAGPEGKKGLSAAEYYDTANLSGSYSIVTDPSSGEYNDKTSVLSAKFGYSLNNEISNYSEIFTTDDNYASITTKEADTNYYTFEEDGNNIKNKQYNIAYFFAYTDEIIVPPIDEPIIDDNSDDTSNDTSTDASNDNSIDNNITGGVDIR